MNNTIKVVEHDDFPEEERDMVTMVLPGYREDRRDLFAQYHKAVDFFRLACEVELDHAN